jgi:amino acid transporter
MTQTAQEEERFEADQWGERMPRTIGVWSAVIVLVGITIGSGIFRVPATVAGLLHAPGPTMLCWLLGGLVALTGALSIAELAAALPRSGGIFVYILEAYGSLPAFLFGWTELAVIRASALGATATIFAEYLGYFVPFTAAQVHQVGALIILVVGVINYMGVRRAVAVLAPTTAVKTAALLALGLLAFTAVSGVPAPHRILWESGTRLSLIAAALVPIMYTYDGWADLAFMGGEIYQPQRTLPLALILGTSSVMLVYLVVNLGIWYALPPYEITHSPLVAATVARRIPLIGTGGGAVIAVLVLVSTFSALHATLMTGSRVLFALADRGLLFRIVRRVSPRFQSPSVAVWISTGLGIFYVLQSDFAQLADRVILGLWPFYMLTVAAVYVLRRKRPDLPRPYRTWGYPIVPALFLAASVGMIASALLTDPRDSVVSLLVIAAGLPIYYVWRGCTRRSTARSGPRPARG